MSIDLDWNGDEISAALVEPFHQANEVLGRAFHAEITANKWDWPSVTTRKSGEKAGSTRDVVDLGNLRRSYAAERTRDGGDPAHDHNWNVDYAMPVHEGAVFKDGRPDLPARPWTKEPLENGTLEEAFEALARRALGKIR